MMFVHVHQYIVFDAELCCFSTVTELWDKDSSELRGCGSDSIKHVQ